MYRVFLFTAVLAYCSSLSLKSTSSNVRKHVRNEENDGTDLIDSVDGGYSYFKKQQIDVRPSAKPTLDIPIQDLSAYMQGSAFKHEPVLRQLLSPSANPSLRNTFGQQQLMPRSDLPVQHLLPKTVQSQQPDFIQNDYPPIPSIVSNKYAAQPTNFPFQSQLSAMNTFGNHQQQQQQNLRGIESQQYLFPQANLNNQQQTWSSSYGNGQGQQPLSSSFLMQSNQQNDQAPITNAVFMSSQLPTQRFSSSKKQISNNGWI